MGLDKVILYSSHSGQFYSVAACALACSSQETIQKEEKKAPQLIADEFFLPSAAMISENNEPFIPPLTHMWVLTVVISCFGKFLSPRNTCVNSSGAFVCHGKKRYCQ